jgi:branched-chain amino acid transport system permease protein
MGDNMILTQLIINGLIAGSIYALVAAGYSLIYSTNRFMHFAHGITIVSSSYMLFLLFSILSIPFIVSCLLTLVFASAFGYGMNKIIYNPLQKRKSSHVILLIASLGISILFENLILLIFGATVKTIGYIKTTQGLSIIGASITVLQIIIFATAMILMGLLYLLTKKTKLGRNMRAVAENTELASITGINHKRIADYSFIIGSFLGGVAGILVALEQNLQSGVGTQLIIKGFTGSIIGGITSVPGSIAGSYLLGLSENLGIWVLPSGYKDAIAFILLIVFLIFKPNGLFGINKGVKL